MPGPQSYVPISQETCASHAGFIRVLHQLRVSLVMVFWISLTVVCYVWPLLMRVQYPLAKMCSELSTMEPDYWCTGLDNLTLQEATNDFSFDSELKSSLLNLSRDGYPTKSLQLWRFQWSSWYNIYKAYLKDVFPHCVQWPLHIPLNPLPVYYKNVLYWALEDPGFPLCLTFYLKFLQPFFLLNHKVMLNLFKEPFRSCWDNVTSVPKNIHMLYYIYWFGWGVLPLHFWNELTWSWYVIFSRYSWLKLISNEKCIYLYVYMCVFPWCIHPHMCAYARAGQDAVLWVSTWGYFCLSMSLCPV